MARTVSLLFGVHAHQPVGNFPEVLEDAHQRCYKPFLDTVYQYPEFRFAAHFSGWLLAWMLEHHPEDMARLREMAARGQVEFFGAGDTEPVLAVIPYRDRMSQIAALSERLDAAFGQRPEGAWLTERVWEATVVPALADSGIRYVMVDDYHFLCAGTPREALDGFFSTEEDGRRLDLFPISEALRYRLPFSPAHEAVGFIESLANEQDHAAAIYFDDIEKFGIWPETYDWVYGRGWLRQFIEGVLASPVIRCEAYRDYHERGRTRGVVYLPTVSYSEMGEWTLPAGAAHRYAELVEAARHGGVLERDRPFIRGGIWKNFLTRYPEANWMHKRMLGLSERLAALPEALQRPELTALLHEAQANDAYWHGLFGGLYLPHLRRSVWRALLRLERELDAIQARPEMVNEDADLDGNEEVFLTDGRLQAVLRSDADAAVVELSSYPLAQNFADTLRRYEEHYFHKVAAGEGHEHGGEGIASAHDMVRFKHAIQHADLVPDPRCRGLFLETWQDAAGHHAVRYGTRLEQEGDTLFQAQVGPASLSKTYRLVGNTLEVVLRVAGQGRLVTELNLAMPSCDGPAGRYVVGDDIPCGFGQALDLEAGLELRLEDLYLGGAVVLRCEPAAQVSGRPHHTVSQSEAGFEKVMQAAHLTLAWEVAGQAEIRLSLEVLTLPGA